MKNWIIVFYLFIMTFIMISCESDDDTFPIITELQCTNANENAQALQKLLFSLSEENYVSGVSDIQKGSDIIGYAITLKDGSFVKLYKEVSSPLISIKQDDNSVFYWTFSGEWLRDDSGNRIVAGLKDGITPLLDIRDNQWTLSVDNRKTWSSVGNVLNNNLLISNIEYSSDSYLTVTLSNKQVIEFPTVRLGSSCGIRSFQFTVKDNPEALMQDVTGNIAGNEIIVWIPYMLANKRLVPTIELANSEAIITQGETGVEVDFSSPVEYIVMNSKGNTRKYSVKVNVFTGLPIVFVETENRYVNPNKEIYVSGNIHISSTFEYPEEFDATLQFKGRGNATWGYPKKPYRIKLDKKASLFGMPKDKSWVLLASYCDKSLMRAGIQFALSRILDMPWTSRMQYVELVLNGQYQGNYILCEHVKTSVNRVSVEEDGYMIEHDNYYKQEAVWFETSLKGYGYSFKTPDPDDGISEEQINYIKEYVDKFEAALYGSDYSDAAEGYRKYIDVESFAKWHLINFILGNQDTNDYYVLTKRGVKLTKGPVWDAEWSLGIGWDEKAPVSFDVPISHTYYSRLFEDTYFKEYVREMWKANKTRIRTELLQYINTTYEYLQKSQESNFEKWDILGNNISVNYTGMGSWENEVLYLKDWLVKRLDWMETYLE